MLLFKPLRIIILFIHENCLRMSIALIRTLSSSLFYAVYQTIWRMHRLLQAVDFFKLCCRYRSYTTGCRCLFKYNKSEEENWIGVRQNLFLPRCMFLQSKSAILLVFGIHNNYRVRLPTTGQICKSLICLNGCLYWSTTGAYLHAV